jgi:hypothetical protein
LSQIQDKAEALCLAILEHDKYSLIELN